jgi:hypothetical protein
MWLGMTAPYLRPVQNLIWNTAAALFVHYFWYCLCLHHTYGGTSSFATERKHYRATSPPLDFEYVVYSDSGCWATEIEVAVGDGGGGGAVTV